MPMFNERDALSYGEVRIGPDSDMCHASALVSVRAASPSEALEALLIAMHAARDAVSLSDCPFSECREVREHHHPSGRAFPAVPAEKGARGQFQGKGHSVAFLGKPRCNEHHRSGGNPTSPHATIDV